MPLGMLGKYERLDVLGHGASGIVYLAKDTLLGRQIALKEIAAQGEERERVLEEARVLDRLRHPNIVHVYGVDEIGGKVVLAMEYVAGRNLQDVLQRAGRLPVAEAVAVAAQICDGLAFAHRNRIVHRDVKPANILIAPDGTVKLVDFGLAQVLGTNSLAGGAGTYAYMAPEDFHEEQQSDHQADIWAVGVILYEMLTGRRPFQPVKVKDPFSWKRAVEETPLDPVTVSRPDAPPLLDSILSHALARDKRARYEDAAVMAQDLRSLALTPEALTPPRPSATLSQAWERVDRLAGPGEGLPPPLGASLALSPGESPLTDIDGFLLLAPDHWEAARAALGSGALAHWLAEIGETPLAAVAQEIAADGGDPDDRLRDFLYRAGLDTVPEARRASEEGIALARAGRFAEALAPLRRAVRLDPTQGAYTQDLAEALRAVGDAVGAALVLEDAPRRPPLTRLLPQNQPQNQKPPVVPVVMEGAQAVLSAHQVDFGTLRQGQNRSAVLTLTSTGGGVLEGRIVATPGWVRVEPPAFAARRRQRLLLTADAAHGGPAPAEYRDVVLLDTAGGRQEIAVHASVLPARRSMAQSFYWYIPLLVCCLLPALAGWEAGTLVPHGGHLLAPGLAASALLCGALFVLTAAADTTWRLRLPPLLLLGLGAWGASPLIAAFANGTDALGRTALIQTSLPLLVLLTLLAVASYADPRGWGRWPLWAWITAATGPLLAYGLLHLSIR